jgi:hypothetical protein
MTEDVYSPRVLTHQTTWHHISEDYNMNMNFLCVCVYKTPEMKSDPQK